MAISKNSFKFFLSFVLLTVGLNCKSQIKAVEQTTSASVAGTLTVSADGVFMRDGKVYQGMGVNYFNAFYRTILKNNDKTYNAGFKYLSDNKIPFIRFTTNGFWPSELKLYRDNKAIYFTLLDEFVKSAETYGIGLIPSLFWFYAAVPDLVGEHINQWGNVNSKTIAFMRTYTAEIVNRYKDSPAIWGWELGNEWNSYVDLLDQAINFLPKVSVSQGTPASRTIEDAFTTDILQTALNEFAKVVRLYDSNRPILSGNGMPSVNSYHRYKFKNWIQDTTSDFTLVLDAQNASLGTLTLHPYPYQEGKYFTGINASLTRIIEESVRSSKELKHPLFIGEFGSPKTLGATIEAQKFQELMSAIIANKVQLSAVWVYDFTSQDADWNITQTNSRKYQLDAVINANAQFLLSAGNVEIKNQIQNYSVYPNPAIDNIQLKVNASTAATQSMSYALYDMQGRLLDTKMILSELTNVATNNLVPSIYFMKIIEGDKEVKVFKIMKN